MAEAATKHKSRKTSPGGFACAAADARMAPRMAARSVHASSRRRRLLLRAVLSALALCVLVAVPTEAGERYALVVTGASGGPQYSERYDEWRSSFVQLLQGPLGYPEDHVLLLAEEEFSGAQKATRENV